MAQLVNRNDVFQLANQLELKLAHYARGSYPVASNEPAALAVNRMLSIVSNPVGENNFIREGNRRHILRPGSIFFIPAGYPAEVHLDDRLIFVSVQFNLELYSGVELLTVLKKVREEHNPELVAWMDREFSSEETLELALNLKSAVLHFIRGICAKNSEFLMESAARFTPYTAVLEYIAAHCTARTRISELAAVMKLPRESFTRRFRSDTGITPKQFFDRQLLRRAEELLRQPHITAREVAYELEFSSEFVFSRFFKTRTGMPPNAFMKACRI